jgi:hypothetical protein
MLNGDLGRFFSGELGGSTRCGAVAAGAGIGGPCGAAWQRAAAAGGAEGGGGVVRRWAAKVWMWDPTSVIVCKISNTGRWGS